MPDNESREQLLSEIANLQKQVEALRELESQHSETEAALRESEGKCRQLFEKMPIGLGFAELDGTLIEFNDAMLEPGGYTREDILKIGNVAELYYDSDERTRILKIAEKEHCVHNEEVRFKRKDGTPYDALLSLTPVQLEGRPCWQAMVEDISNRKRAEETLRESEESWRSLVENAQDIIMTVDVDGTILFINRTVSGLRVDQTIGTKIFDYILPEYHLEVRECVRQVIQTGDVDSYEIAGTGPDSTTSWYRTRVGPIMRNDEIVALSLITTDITKNKVAEQALRDSEGHYRDMYENAPIAYFGVDKEGTIQMANRRAGELLGYGLERLVGRPVLELYKDTPSGKEKALRVLQQFQDGREIHDEELEMCGAEGQTIWVSLTVLPLRNSEGEVVASRSMAIDITHRKQTEREFIRLERLQALGEMGQGVAHNFNNLLVGVLGYAQLIQMKSEHDEINNFAEHIVDSAMRAKELVERLNRAVQGEKKESIQQVHVVETVLEAIQESRPRWKDESEASGIFIEVDTDLQDVPSVAATRSGLQDILINLIFNAVDALPEGGTITVTTNTMENIVLVTVGDTGVGMDEETKRRVFEPFFTTKADIGTGLGLSAAYSTMARWGGNVEVDSSPENGTTVGLQLPVWESVEEEVTSTQASVRPANILVVDDDQMVRQYLQNVLSEVHKVDIAQDGQQALEYFRDRKYDVALVDLGMPGMRGDRVVEEMKRLDATIASILITGWAPEHNDPRVVVFDFQLQKPFADLQSIYEIVGKAVELHDNRTADTP
jgi:PAS domain S-box-containing protein